MIPISDIDAVIFDTNGVITDTAKLHAAAWKTVLDSFLRGWSSAFGAQYRPFDAHADYLRYVDGKPHLDGVRDFLTARGVHADDVAVVEIACRKDVLYLDQIRRLGMVVFPSAVALARTLRRRHIPTAVVSPSRNCAEVLRLVGVADLFDVRVDGLSARLGLAGKLDPALFLEAARRLGVVAGRATVIEDSLAGVAAARRGGFGLVVGVDRGGQARALYDGGADVVVTDLAALAGDGSDHEPMAADL